MLPISLEMFEALSCLLTHFMHFSDTLFSAIVGSAVGGLLSLAGVWYTQTQTEKARKKREQEELRSLLASLRTELQTIWEQYSITVAKKIEEIKTKKAMYARVPISHELTTVYDTNASKIGMITDDKLRTKIVATYVCIKTFVDYLLVNGDYYDEFRNYVADHKKRDSYSQVTEDFLVEFGQQLESSYEQIKGDIEELIPMLNQAVETLPDSIKRASKFSTLLS